MEEKLQPMSQSDATTLFPNAGWLHWSALRLGMAGSLPSQRAHARTQVTSFGTSEGSIFLFFPCSSWILFKILKEFKILIIICGQKPCYHLTCARVFATCKMKEYQRVVHRAVVLMGGGMETLWSSLTSFTLRPDPTLHPLTSTSAPSVAPQFLAT